MLRSIGFLFSYVKSFFVHRCIASSVSIEHRIFFNVKIKFLFVYDDLKSGDRNSHAFNNIHGAKSHSMSFLVEKWLEKG